MCGRYQRRSDKQRIAEVFHVDAGLDEVDFAANDTANPGAFQPVVRMNEAGETIIQSMYWCFQLPDRFVFNARSDTLSKNSLWKGTLVNQRCIVPADSIIEWQHLYKDTKKNPKYEITIPGQEPFGMAAIWRSWKHSKTGQTVPTMAIITTDPNEEWAKIHDRETAILNPNEYREWLTPSERPPLHALRVFPSAEMSLWLLNPGSGQLSLLGL